MEWLGKPLRPIRRPLFPVFALALTALVAAGCASAPVQRDGITINDPYEAQNRRVHAFNKGLDARVIGPVANRLKGSDDDDTAPRDPDAPIGPLQMVINAGRNLSLPVKSVNGLLQGRPGDAGANFARFAVNSTVGLGGIFDPATDSFGLTERNTDFGQTLAVWGVPEGAYLELPLLGPSTQRDAVGQVADLLIDPLYHLLDGPEAGAVFGLRVASKAGDRARFGDTVDGILQGSADSYAQTRLIWLMNRRFDLGETRDDYDPYDDVEVMDPDQD
ncbi:VacJ family lipoprotein [Paracoccus liaowanqingii]|uniref:VacJ family lipoprotein n=1 Tax=Paracoccus liaowanqingii TaxID=2560053 RepID=A0A4Z1C0Z3_9RHOB|nr:VacJ family lipoprotein [Paracoccus liaowanqingii]